MGGDLTERGDVVENPEAAAVSADDQIVLVVIGMEIEIADGSAGQVLAERLPVIPVIEAGINGGLGSGEEQARLRGIGAQGIHPASGALILAQAADNAAPGFAAIHSAPA